MVNLVLILAVLLLAIYIDNYRKKSEKEMKYLKDKIDYILSAERSGYDTLYALIEADKEEREEALKAIELAVNVKNNPSNNIPKEHIDLFSEWVNGAIE